MSVLRSEGAKSKEGTGVRINRQKSQQYVKNRQQRSSDL